MPPAPRRENDGRGEETSTAGGRSSLSNILRSLADDGAGRERISIRDLLDALGDCALAVLMFV
ncbi:MAG: hypothetical protein LBS49_11640, partial [Candidatus Accumulibacter sp.]|nr:hypothetical protein [Accumulibacter sp.]